ncbi:MAG: hypothetical protein ACSHX7_04890 [Luteolibacter sp.]
MSEPTNWISSGAEPIHCSQRNMDPRIIAAIITGGVAFSIPLLTWVVKNLSYSAISGRKRRALQGSWRGTTKQSSGPKGKPIEVDLVIDFKTRWRRVKGISRVKGGGDELDVTFVGGYKELDHVFFEYQSKSKDKVNFGSVILKLNGCGNELHGKIIGYGNMSETLVSGDMTLTKI